MTRAKALKDYFKKFYDIDAEGMTAVDVTQDFLKKKYDYDSGAATYTGVIQEMVDNELSPSGGGGVTPELEISISRQEIIDLNNNTINFIAGRYDNLYYLKLGNINSSFKEGDLCYFNSPRIQNVTLSFNVDTPSVCWPIITDTSNILVGQIESDIIVGVHASEDLAPTVDDLLNGLFGSSDLDEKIICNLYAGNPLR